MGSNPVLAALSEAVALYGSTDNIGVLLSVGTGKRVFKQGADTCCVVNSIARAQSRLFPRTHAINALIGIVSLSRQYSAVHLLISPSQPLRYASQVSSNPILGCGIWQMNVSTQCFTMIWQKHQPGFS